MLGSKGIEKIVFDEKNEETKELKAMLSKYFSGNWCNYISLQVELMHEIIQGHAKSHLSLSLITNTIMRAYELRVIQLN